MRIAFNTLGCKLNQYDTELLREMAEDAFYEITDFNDTADIYVINTCSVTMNATQQSRNMVRRARRRSNKAKIIVTGCFPEKMRDELQETDIYVPNSEKNIFFENFFGLKKKNISNFAEHTRAFVKIQTGCNRFCSYCIVPYLRGREFSRPLDEITEEVSNLIENGFVEISITGVHIGRYNYNGSNLITLLKNIESIEGLERIRLGSLNPEEITDELIDYVSHSQKLCHHFHISLQSGDNKILKSMGRKYSSSEVSRKIIGIKKLTPDCGIGADIITGFPAEGELEFQNTYNFISELPFTYLHIFRYSERKGTLAAVFPEKVDESDKKERSKLLRELGLKKSITFRKRYIGKDLKVLIESKRDRLTKRMVGFSGNYIRVLVPEQPNIESEYSNVRIEKVEGYDTYGRITKMEDNQNHDTGH